MKYLYKNLIKENGLTIRGVLNTPDDFDESRVYPTVIYYHGFADDRNGIQFMNIQNSKFLTAQDYLVYRFDFSGCGESDGSFYDVTMTRQAEEAILIYDFVASEPNVDTKNIFIKGHSLGGAVATIIASKVNPKAMSLYSPAADFSRKENKLMEKIMSAFKCSRKGEGDDVGGLKIGETFVNDVLAYDLYDYAIRYEGPVQILRGSEDDVISEKSNRKLAAAFPKATYLEIEGTDHNFSDYDQRLESFELMYEFLNKHMN